MVSNNSISNISNTQQYSASSQSNKGISSPPCVPDRLLLNCLLHATAGHGLTWGLLNSYSANSVYNKVKSSLIEIYL